MGKYKIAFVCILVVSIAYVGYGTAFFGLWPQSQQAPPQPQPSVALTDERWWCKYNDFGSGTYYMGVDFNLTETNGVHSRVLVKVEDIGPGFGRTARTYYVQGHSTESGSFIITNMSECSSNPFVKVISVERLE